MVIEEAVRGGMEVGDGSEDAALEATLGHRMAKKRSTALSQDAEVGVKRKVERGWCVSHRRTAGCL